jgi:tRNA-specific 2-thiouridylase
VGQRKGLGVSIGSPLYVLKLQPVDQRVVVGPREALGGRELTAERVNWIAGAPPDGPTRVTARIRHRHQDAPATVVADGGTTAHLTFDDPQVAITPGQAVVFYDDLDVVGGGWIASR